MNDASMGMINLLSTDKKLTRLDAYGLASVAMDCPVGAISEPKRMSIALCPRTFVAGNR
jgi:acetamidase/formamidase